MFADEIEKRTVSDVRNWLEPNFSTTTLDDKTIGRVVLMSAMKKFFDYTEMMCVCGIPNVTLEGTLEDWRDIRVRTEKLFEYGLEEWGNKLLHIIDKFIESYQGNVDKEFWGSIITYNRGQYVGPC